MNDIRCTIKKAISILSENERGYTKEVNLVSWNDNAPKLDIRQWHPGHERCGKGSTDGDVCWRDYTDESTL